MIQSVKKPTTSPIEPAATDLSTENFEFVFGQYWEHVYRVVHRLVFDPAEAEDLALEAFLRLYERLPIQDANFQTGGWLYRVATNLGLHSIRSFKRREHYEQNAGKYALESEPETHPAEVYAEKEQNHLARQALAQMNERRAQLLVLRYSGLSYKEIAAALSLSPASIGPLLLRAEREFETCYRALAQEEP